MRTHAVCIVQEAGFFDCPRKEYCTDRDRPFAVRRSQTGRSGLVDPGVPAQLECLLDDVLVGKQEMIGAFDAVCDVAQRIIGKLTEGAAAGASLACRLRRQWRKRAQAVPKQIESARMRMPDTISSK
jgi:hypothetical protein